MPKAAALARQLPAIGEWARSAIVLGCAIALIAAGRFLPIAL
jgi:hypothetical protein